MQRYWTILPALAIAAVAASVSCKPQDSAPDPFDKCDVALFCVDAGTAIEQCESAHNVAISDCCAVPAAEACAGSTFYASCVDNYYPDVCAVYGGSSGPDGDDDASVSISSAGSMSSGGSATTADSGADETGGACPEWGKYRCEGWVVGLYSTDAAPTNYEFAFGATVMGQCIDEIEICVVDVGTDDSAFLFEECRDACEAMNWGWPSVPPTGNHNAWELRKSVCVFAPDGAQGYVPQGLENVTDQPGVMDCPNVGPTGSGIQQVFYVDTCDDSECVSPSCTGWNPNGAISYSYNATTRVHTVSMARSYVENLMDSDYARLYECDPGRYEEVSTGVWKMQDMVSGDFLYRLGFRHGDYDLRIRRNISFVWWYTLQGFMQIADAYDALHTYNALQVEFKRINAATGQPETHKINITLT